MAFNLIEKLIPKKGFLWRIFPGYFKDLLDGLNEEPKRLKAFLEKIVTESNPGTAVDTQEEWYQQYGLPYNSTKSLSEKQAETLERYIALGAQDISYLQAQVTKAGFDDVIIYENSPPDLDNSNVCGDAICGEAECWGGGNGGLWGEDWIFYYYVIGTVDNDEERTRLESLLEKLAPAHLVPEFSISSSDNVCNVAVCGDAVCDG